MKNKFFMTIGGAVAALCPWVTHAETFPTDGKMLENKTYESAATYNNLGVYDGTVNATAEYMDTLYNIGGGSYLPAGAEVGAACTAGYYCPGLVDAKYNESSNQGLTACPNGYPHSDTGASMDTQCYRSCALASVAHATAVAGNDYYSGMDTCYATACENGYHMNDEFIMVERAPFVDVDPENYQRGGLAYISLDGSQKKDDSIYGLTQNNTWAADIDGAVVYGHASCQSDMPEGTYYIGDYSGILSSSVDVVRSALQDAGVDAARINAVADAHSKYHAGAIDNMHLRTLVNAAISNFYDIELSTTDTGQYCFCQMTDFKPIGGVKGMVISTPWVMYTRYTSMDRMNCAENCAEYCGREIVSHSASGRDYRKMLLGMLSGRLVTQCVANEISITWADADPADVAANNAGMCTYDGDIRTPVKAATKPGKTFKGWKFIKKN